MSASNHDNSQRINGCTIVCGPMAVQSTRLALKIYRDAGLDIPMTVLMPERCARDEGWKEFPAIRIAVDEEVKDRDRVLSFLTTAHNSGYLKGRSTNWYLQQYLKLAHSWEALGSVFIHDGDTIFAPLLLAELQVSPYLLTTNEDTTAYNAAARECGLPTYKASFVANGGIFLPAVLKSLSSDPAEWFLEIIKKGVIADGVTGDFSEYQIMGSLLRQNFPIHKIKMFRRFDLLVQPNLDSLAERKCAAALKKYDAIAFEMGHRSTPLRKVLGRLAYSVGYSW